MTPPTLEEFEELYTATRLGWRPAMREPVWVRDNGAILAGVVIPGWDISRVDRCWVQFQGEDRQIVVYYEHIAPRFARDV